MLIIIGWCYKYSVRLPSLITRIRCWLSCRVGNMLAACKLTVIFWFLLLSLHLSATLSRKENSENSGIVIKKNSENSGIVMTLHRMRSEERFVAVEAAGSNHDDRSFQRLASMVQASKARVLALKHGMHKNMKNNSISGEGSLYAYDNEYYIKLWVGTPPQEVSLAMDTGSDVVWVACTTTRQYKCYNGCPKHPTVFLPRKSSSAVPVKCADPRCKDLCENEGCVGSIQNCSGVCPEYSLAYGTGNATGRLLSETLTLPFEDGGRREIKNFGVGCSVLSFVAAGIAGFGTGGLSMSSQLGPIFGNKFAYCLQSYQLYENTNKSSRMVLGNKAVPKDIALDYTPFLKNSRAPSYNTFYYLGLTAISIGGKRLKLPSKFLTFDSDGNGGTFIDSGTSFSDFPDEIYSQIVGELASLIGYRRAPKVEAKSGFGLCYTVSVSGVENVKFPEFVFHFKGGSDMVLPSENTFIGDSHTHCLAMTNSTYSGGPAVTLGNYQQQNFYILYDRQYNRLGFTPKTCDTFG